MIWFGTYGVLIHLPAGLTQKKSGACIGNIISPFFYLTSQAPRYQLGIGSLLVANCLEFLIFLILRFAFIYENKKKERAAAERGVTHEDITAFSDMTDKENPK